MELLDAPLALPVFTDPSVTIDIGSTILNAASSANNAPVGAIVALVVWILMRLFRRKAKSS